MQISFNGARRSASLKIFVIGFLTLLMLIPMAMIRDVIRDRQHAATQARNDITRAWGGAQTIGGPVLIVPYTLTQVTQYGKRVVSEGRVHWLPDTLNIDAQLSTEVRYRGLHEVPVYTAQTRIRGGFSAVDTDGLGIDNAVLDWSRSFVALSISDARAIRNAPVIEIEGHAVRFEAGGKQLANMAPQIIAPLGTAMSLDGPIGAVNFAIDLDLSGTDRLQVLPLADTTNVRLESAWPSPSFTGKYLPETREIRDDGFNATWRISSLGRDLPSRWIDNEQDSWHADNAAFGVDLFVPIGLYQLSTRATKYAVLFIGLTFVGYFMFEAVGGLRLHPLQYLLVGLANSIFYLLLLSLSEHVGFGGAYVLSSLASTGLIAGYSVTVLKSRKRAMTMVGILALLYSYLYMTLQAESYAMLTGSIGLWVTLALVMYLTRRIDWYATSNDT